MFNRQFDIQFFADGGNDSSPSEPVPAPQPAADPTAGGKVFSEEYVHTLRQESAGYRQTAKTYETALRSVLGVADGDDLGNINERISAMQTAHKTELDNMLKKANDRLIAAQIQSLDGYDTKLLSKVIDLSGVKVNEDGAVEGLSEAVKAAETEFPAVRKTDTPPPYAVGTGSQTGGMKNSPEINAFRSAAGLKAE